MYLKGNNLLHAKIMCLCINCSAHNCKNNYWSQIPLSYYSYHIIKLLLRESHLPEHFYLLVIILQTLFEHLCHQNALCLLVSKMLDSAIPGSHSLKSMAANLFWVKATRRMLEFQVGTTCLLTVTTPSHTCWHTTINCIKFFQNSKAKLSIFNSQVKKKIINGLLLQKTHLTIRTLTTPYI